MPNSKHERGRRFDIATDQVANYIEYGHLLAETDAEGFMEAVASKLGKLEKTIAELQECCEGRE